MQVYGSHGYIDAKNGNSMSILEKESQGPYDHTPPAIESNQKDPFRLLLEVTKYGKNLDPFSLYTLENNLIVSKILTLAKKASETKQTLSLERVIKVESVPFLNKYAHSLMFSKFITCQKF